MSPIFKPHGQVDRIVIAAPGPSLTKEQLNMVADSHVMNIVIGDAWRFNPYADLLYHCDRRWWLHYEGVRDFKGCARVSLDDTGLCDVGHLHEALEREGLSLKESTVVTGSNSGYQAINLAAHYKPKEIILIGYDMKKAADGKYNIIGDHPKEVKAWFSFQKFIQKISTLVKPLEDLGITVYNCSIDSDLNCFERKELKDVL